MVKYRLTYFNLRGRAEIPRLIFAVAGQEFEDVRIDGKNDWPSLKSKTPQGTLPILEIEESNGCKVVIPQSMAICRHLARAFDMYGRNKSEMTSVDVVLDSIVDMRTQLYNIHTEIQKANKTKKDELERKIRNEVLPRFLSIFNGIAKDNDKKAYLVSDSLTVADLALYDAFSMILQKFNNVLDLAPNLKVKFQKVACNSKLKAWVEKRPKTEF